MKLRHVLLSGAIAIGFSTPSPADDLTVSTATTNELKTSGASGGTAGNITITSSGSVTTSGTNAAAVTVDSSNTLTNQGTIANTATSSAIGVNLVAGNAGSFSNVGTISIPGTGTPPSSTGEFGVLVNGTGVFAGDIIAASGSKIVVSGSGAQAIAVQAELGGNLLLSGNITATGASSSALITTVPIDGAFVNRGTILSQSGTTSTVTANAQPGITVGFGGSIPGGILNAGPVNAADNTAAASIKSSGSLPVLDIAPSLASNAADLAVGAVVDNTNPGFGFINRGIIANDGTQPGISTLGIQIGNATGDTSGKLTSIAGGFYNSGTVRASATSDNSKATAAAVAASDANAILIGVGANVPTIVNPTNATITATTGGPLGGTATAVWIQAGGTLSSINNSGTISADAVATNLKTASLTAYAIRDANGVLTQVNNSGTISATTTVLDNNTQLAIAIDASAASVPLTLTNSGAVVGNVGLGTSNASQITIAGAHASLAGIVTTRANGRVAISVSPGGVGGSLETASVNKASTFAVGSGGTVTFDIGQNATIINTSGAASLDANSHILLKPVSLVTVGSIALIHSDTSLTINGNLNTIASGATIPFLYNGSIGSDPKNLTLTIARKSADQLGLTGTASAVYEPVMTAAANDAALAAALGTLPDSQHVQAALEQFQPLDAGYLRSTALFFTDPNSDSVGTRQRRLTFNPQGDGFSAWTSVDVDKLSFDAGDGHGAGATMGLDFNASKKGHLGIAFALQETHLKQDVNDAATKATWYLFTPYLGFQADNFFFNAQVNAGSTSITTHRTVTVGATERISSGSTSETLASGSLTGGYIFNLTGWTVAPQVTFSALKMADLSYAESGGGAGVDLTVHSGSLSAMRVFAGVALSSDYEVFGDHLVPQVLAGWNQAIDTSGAKVTASFVSAPDATFALVGPQTEQSGFLGAAHLDYGNDFTAISLGYDGMVGGKTNAQSATVRITARF